MQPIDFAADSPRQTSNMDLTDVSQLCQEQIELEDKLEVAEARVEELKEKLREVSEKKLPDLLKERGLSEVRLAQGHKLVMKDQYFASIPVENRETSHKWFREKGFGDLIKNLLTLSFGRGEDNRAAQLLEELKSRGFEPQQNQSIHPQTLKAFVREQLTSGNHIPEEVVKVTIVPKVKIERKKSDG